MHETISPNIMTLAKKHKIAQNFSHAAPHYDSHALLQKQVREQLYQWLPQQNGEIWLDAGSGPGQLARDHASQRVLSLDLAPGMSQHAASFGDAITADMEQLPLSTASMTVVFSSLAAQWLPHNGPFWREAARVTQPLGTLLIATLVEGTLSALKTAYEHANIPHTGLTFLSESQLKNNIITAGWEIIATETQPFTTTHASGQKLLRHFKKIGATAPTGKNAIRHRGDLHTLEQCYPARLANGRIQANWQVAFIKAKKPT